MAIDADRHARLESLRRTRRERCNCLVEPDSLAPAVAIIVRTKSRPALLRRAMRSIVAQTFQDWEAIIVNDGGSPDDVIEVLAEHDSSIQARVKVVHNADSVGRWPAANLGINASESALLVLHDDDDSWHPDFLDESVAFLVANPEERGVIARTEVLIEDHDGEDIKTKSRYVLEEHKPMVLLQDLLDFNRFVPISFLYRRTVHEELGLYEQNMPAAADWAFNMKVLARQPLQYVGERILAYWHQRPELSGVLGNSVFAAPSDHRLADSRYRDDALRAYIQDYGPGLPLYLAHQARQRDQSVEVAVATAVTDAVSAAEQRLATRIDERFTALERTIDTLQSHLDRTVDARVRGWVWRQKTRIRRVRLR